MLLTDIAAGWTECVQILLRESGVVIEAMAKAKKLFPFPLRGVDCDNDGVFMNEAVIGWCREAGLEVTRARAYRKNDQAWVEQKNGAVVRRLVGYGRFEGVAAAQALSRLYAAAPARQPVPAVVQAEREDPGRCADRQALSPTGAAAHAGDGGCRDQ